MRRLAAAFVALACTYAGSARAFSDPLSFGDEVGLGGGGGRYFTGSVADGYGCNVCHSGASPPAIEVLGLPRRGYAPSTSYEITVVWPASVEHVGLALEITDDRGVAAGQLRLPPAHELPDAERCEPAADGVHAGVLHELPGRTILQVPDCGAQRVRFLWTAPASVPNVVLFAGGIVAADGDANVDRDGVTMLSRPLTRTGGRAVTTLQGSCSATLANARTPAFQTTACLLLLAFALVARARRLARR